jgi:hypothetical protein
VAGKESEKKKVPQKSASGSVVKKTNKTKVLCFFCCEGKRPRRSFLKGVLPYLGKKQKEAAGNGTVIAHE